MFGQLHTNHFGATFGNMLGDLKHDGATARNMSGDLTHDWATLINRSGDVNTIGRVPKHVGWLKNGWAILRTCRAT